MALALCQLQPYLTTCVTKVVKCAEGKAEEEKPEEKKAAKKGAKPTAAAVVYDIELEQSVLFPKGGGQPSDVGELQPAEGKALSVQSVFRDPNGRVIHRTDSPLAEGVEVKVVVDWDRRYDHMQQHSAQHLISAVADKVCGAETLSWWLASAPDPCNIDFHQEITQEKLDEILYDCNAIIRSGVEIGMHVFHSLEEAAQHPAFRSGKHPVPANMAGPLRVIEIPGVDYNKCCGTHLKNTAEMQFIQFVKTEKLKGMFRVHFLAGNRSVSSAVNNAEVCKQLGNVLCTSTADLPARVTKLQTDFKVMKKGLEKAQGELAELEAQRLASLGVPFVSLHKSESDLEYISLVANALGQIPSAQNTLALLTYSEGPAGKEGGFLLTGPAEVVKAAGPRVATALEGRGGGRPGRYQGKAARLDLVPSIVAQLSGELLKDVSPTPAAAASGSGSGNGFCSNLECVGRATAKGGLCAACAAR